MGRKIKTNTQTNKPTPGGGGDIGKCHPSEPTVHLDFTSVDSGFLGVTIYNVTYLYRHFYNFFFRLKRQIDKISPLNGRLVMF